MKNEIWFKRATMIFNEWARRYAEAPENFSDILDKEGKPYENYGELAAATFKHIAEEMDAKDLLPKPEAP